MKTFTNSSFLISLVFVVLVSVNSLNLYDNNISNVINLNPKNFDSQITQNRAKNVISFVHFYKPDDGKSRSYKLEIEKFANDNDGMFKVGALNCKEFAEICEKNQVKDFPTFKAFPPLPAPAYNYEGKIEAAHIATNLSGYVGNKAIEVHNNNIDEFVRDSPNIPKVFLFTERKGFPLIYKALSVAFDKKLDFAIVRSSETGIVSKYRIKSFPTIMVLTAGERKQKIYEDQINYKKLFDFLNIFSETFFRVGEDKARASDSTKAEKPWLHEKLPEFTKESGNDICFKVEGTVCVILINGEKPSQDLSNIMSELQNHLAPKIDRGIKYKFGWVNSSVQTKFIEALGLSNGDGPRMVVVNPGSRKRFYIMENDLNEKNMKNVFERLAGGELRFKNFNKNTIPELD